MRPPRADVMIFESDRFSLDPPVENGIPYDLPLGDDVAAFLAAGMRATFNDVCTAEPIREDWGTVLFVSVAGESYEVDVHWAPSGGGPDNMWAIQFTRRHGCLLSLFGRRRPAHETASRIMNCVGAVVQSDPQIFRNVRWLTDDEFRKVY